jgi:hypothetical protein
MIENMRRVYNVIYRLYYELCLLLSIMHFCVACLINVQKYLGLPTSTHLVKFNENLSVCSILHNVIALINKQVTSNERGIIMNFLR